MAQTALVALRQEWLEAWQSVAFRRKMLIGISLVIAILITYPFYFQAIEKRHGFVMPDLLLRSLPPHDVSLAIFIIIWAISLLGIVRAARNPYMLLTFFWGYIFLALSRMITITLVPLAPPPGLVSLIDPIANFFYGEKVITKDLFYSGHTSTIFLLFFCFPGKTDKKLGLIATACVACLLLVQHIHYTLDVIFAFPFGWISYRFGRLMAR